MARNLVAPRTRVHSAAFASKDGRQFGHRPFAPDLPAPWLPRTSLRSVLFAGVASQQACVFAPLGRVSNLLPSATSGLFLSVSGPSAERGPSYPRMAFLRRNTNVRCAHESREQHSVRRSRKLIERCGEAVAGADRISAGRQGGRPDQDPRSRWHRRRPAYGAWARVAGDDRRRSPPDARLGEPLEGRGSLRRIRAASADRGLRRVRGASRERHSDEPARDHPRRRAGRLEGRSSPL